MSRLGTAGIAGLIVLGLCGANPARARDVTFEEDAGGELVFRGKTTPLPEIPVGVDGGWKREWNREGEGGVVLDYYIKVG